MATAQATKTGTRRSTRTASNDRKRTGEKGAAKSKLREWFDALVFAVVVMLIVRTLFFDLFRIPTPSMEKNLLVGDYLFVSKLHYGTRLPLTLGVPFTQIYVPGLHFPYYRLPGFTTIQRGDAIVFNWPPENLSYQRLGASQPVVEYLKEAEDLPIDRKTHYIKRVVGMPGETLEIRDKVVSINGEAQPLRPGMQQYWYVHKTEPRVRLSESSLEALGIPREKIGQTNDPSIVQIQATPEAVEQIRQWPWVARVEPAIALPDPNFSALLYPAGPLQSTDRFGPLTIPKRGMTIDLSAANWPAYEPVIRRYEGHTTNVRPDGTFEIDGQVVARYTFAQDYYFAMGDNRDDSEDSRFWGFVPMDHIVGKAILVYFSWDKEAWLPRFNRLFRLVS